MGRILILPDTGYRILPDSADWISGRIVPNTGYRISGTGYRIPDYPAPDSTEYYRIPDIFFQFFRKISKNFSEIFSKFFKNFKISDFMPRMALYHQINDYFEVFELFGCFFPLFFTVFHCFFTIRYPVSGTGYRISGFNRIFDTGYRIPDIRPDIR